ncbi:hypothetical protein CYMTET_50828 [Cymbomonas tetramitiformis]|uniref:Uncharacterized protein n=1 Tax=Cymbomonas tetramitiformis TaxID=36881 RepID=A0AAE0ESF4_9CHLO|nr:hypothetical protein CYMTET_50828 [Cymbomonas tetramitiformis]
MWRWLDMQTEQYRVVPPAKGERVDEWDTALEGRGEVRWLYLAHLMRSETIKVASLQPYLSPINNYHEDMGFDGPAKGRSVSRAVKGVSSLQAAAVDTHDEEETVRTWLPARHVARVHAHGLAMRPAGKAEMELLRTCTYVVFAFVTFGQIDTGVSMQRSHIAVISMVLHKEKGKRHVRLKRWLTIPAAGVEGLVQLGAACSLEHWQGARDGWWQLSSSPCGEAEGGTYWRLPLEQGRLMPPQANDWVQLALGTLKCLPLEDGHFSGHSIRKDGMVMMEIVGTS